MRRQQAGSPAGASSSVPALPSNDEAVAPEPGGAVAEPFPRASGAGTSPRVLTVTELNRGIHDLLEARFADVWVEGEVSDPRTFPSGHTYFTLKDAESQLQAVLFKGAAQDVKFELSHGLVVVARGRVSSYVRRGQVQLIVSALQPKAKGALQLAFEQLKARLAAEGLFDPSRKKPIPRFPRRVGIVTSQAGAALRDMLTILRRRFGGLHIRIMPVQVQGDAAAPQISEAVRDFNEHFPDTDVLLVGRGGGSIEDLWAFNEESVARAIAASSIPVISCVGHETDFTIADFAADLRAPTPSAAAELAVPDKAEVRASLARLGERLRAGLSQLARRAEDRLRLLSAGPCLADPRRLLEEPSRRLDDAWARLGQALAQAAQRAQAGLALQSGKLAALSPLNVLSRGYAIAFRLPGRAVLRSSKGLPAGAEVEVRLHEGSFTAEVKSAQEAA